MAELVADLMKIGLTEYEARAYSALVSISEGGAGDVSKESGIPRARVYDVMERLSSKGFIEVSASRPSRYKAIEPRHVIPGIIVELNSVVDNILARLQENAKKRDRGPTLVWLIGDEKAINIRMSELLQSAGRYVTLIAGNRTLLLGSAALIAKISERATVTVVTERDADAFKGLFGRAEIWRANRPLLLDERRPRVFDYPSREGGKAFIIELIMVSDNDSLVVYRQDGKRLAMGIEDSIIDSWLRSSVRDVTQSAKRL
ncbi:MAG TPA: helix-turn-helix domain-containing protein [Methanomassiliicoccales archaeon]|nr:helix-turn-helix domain-containing protein [Methanomassiliicoccales archaeon]